MLCRLGALPPKNKLLLLSYFHQFILEGPFLFLQEIICIAHQSPAGHLTAIQKMRMGHSRTVFFPPFFFGLGLSQFPNCLDRSASIRTIVTLKAAFLDLSLFHPIFLFSFTPDSCSTRQMQLNFFSTSFGSVERSTNTHKNKFVSPHS